MAIALLLLAAVDFGLLIWAVRASTRDPRNTPLVLQTVLLGLLWFDAATVATGGWIGAGPVLENMSRIRYTWFYLTMPLLLPASATLLRQSGFAFARGRWLLAVSVGLAVVFVLRDAPMAWTATYRTACFDDTVRYVFKVPIGQACAEGQEGLGGGGFSPAIPLIFLAVGLTGLFLWLRHGWPWLGLAVLGFIGITAMPASFAGPYLTYPADTLMTAAFVFAALRFPPKA